MATMIAAATVPIWRDERGVAWVDDTNTKVAEVALDWIAHGSSPAEIHFQHPHLSLAQIHAALSYYFQHREEIDQEIEEGYRYAEAQRAKTVETPLQRRLRVLRQNAS